MAFARMIGVLGAGVALAFVASTYGEQLLAESEEPQSPAPAEPPMVLKGTARVIDGDSLEIGGHTLALVGIDAPEMDQTCTFYGESEPCGQNAADNLFQHSAGASVRCARIGGTAQGEWLARCEAGGVDLGRAMVADGWALAMPEQSPDYVALEVEALDNHRGLWAGEFLPPAQWRKEHGK